MRAIILWFAVATLTVMASAQEFEAVVIKPNKTASTGSSTNSTMSQLTGTNVSLRNLVVMAYGVRDYQVDAPEWLRVERFDVAAKFPEEVAGRKDNFNASFQTMMQKMLLERFKLAVHRETRSLPVYGLVVARNGSKLKVAADCTSHTQNNNNGHFAGICLSMDNFAAFVARRMDQPVLNMTGLTGGYDMEFTFADSDRMTTDAKSDTAPDPGLTLEQVIQDKLGLKLETRKAPVDIVVVDHAEKVPIEN